ncbi:DUF4123 domain-containing protein [Achromobacter mucicolens]|uniref:DUF4123 domain-containing protein n=2 Tax=Achromobacter mucicolens TaxID=1389922 RepID=A0ABD4YVK8_9BURK|nr:MULTISPECIES: DUF4123 domain-containing protein [Achromobacter]MCP2515744.1 DUF4123 domain-containing protein [Achromobacter mucicolens]MDH1179035.1 DUF4123 domain-containing protein [Achromobacter mucicolens]UDG73738.1 DUF4123 domain-containing protein [Achromobacter sp. 77]WGJ88741.1 DUF4123 domain-containing protein [Achromobacter mucicolens]
MLMDAAKFTYATDRLPGLIQQAEIPLPPDLDRHCVLLDAAIDDNLLASLYAERDAEGWAVEPLFLGTPLQPLSNVGPHLVQTWRGSRVIGDILSRMEHEPMGITLFPKDGATWEQLCNHCRTWLSVTGEGERPMQLRWFDPRWTRALLTVLTPVQRQALAGPWQALSWHDMGRWNHWASDPLDAEEEWTRPVFDKALLARLDDERRWDTAAALTLDYEQCFPRGDSDADHRWSYRTLTDAACYGITQLARLERWFRLALVHGQDFHRRHPHVESLLRDATRLQSERLSLLEDLFEEGKAS